MDVKDTARNNLLNRLIRTVASNTASYDSTAEKMIVVDRQGRSHERRPYGLNLFAAYKYFLINYVQQATYNGPLCTLHHDDTDISLLLDLNLKCNLKDARILAETVFAAAGTPINIHALIQAETESFNQKNTLFDNFQEKKRQLESQLKDRLRDMGLTALKLLIIVKAGTEPAPGEVNISAFKVRLKDTIPQAKISLSGLIVMRKGQEAVALNKKFTVDAIEDEIIQVTRRCLQQYVGPEELYRNYNTSVKQRLEQEINKLLNTYGREIDNLFITITRNGRLDAITVESNGGVHMRLSTSHQPLSMSYRCELVADPSAHEKVHLFPADTPEMEEIILDQIKTTLARDVSLEEFDRSLNTTVSTKLAKAINTRISSWGRIAGYLHLATLTELPPPDVEIKHSVSCITRDGATINVNNTVYLRKDYDAHKIFEAHQIPDLFSWGIKEIERIDKTYILDKTYNELRYRFKEDDIRNELEKEATKIGYKINQLAIIPEFEGYQQNDRVNVKYEDGNLSSRIDGISLAVSVSIDGRITDINKTLSQLGYKESISSSLTKAIGVKMKQVFRSVDPDRFYQRFYSTPHKEQTLEAQIKEVITSMVNNDYGIEVRDIAVNPINTRLIKRLRELQKGTCYCEFNDITGLQHYKAMVAILSIDPEGWSIFNARGYKPCSENGGHDVEREDIVLHIKAYMENMLNNFLIPNANTDSPLSTEDLSDKLAEKFNELCDEVRDFFGLNICIFRPVKINMEGAVNFRKRQANIVKLNDGINTNVHLFKLSTEEKRKRLEELYRRRRENRDELLNGPELVQINEEIKSLEADEYRLYSSLKMDNATSDNQFDDHDEKGDPEASSKADDEPESPNL